MGNVHIQQEQFRYGIAFSIKTLFCGCLLVLVIFLVLINVDNMPRLELNKTFREPLPKIKMYVENDRNLVLCVTYQGRLGNNMFQFAAAFGIAKQKNITLIISNDNPLLKVFNISTLPLKQLGLPVNFCSRISPLEDRWHSSYDPAFIANITKSDMHLKGFFQSWRYWRAYEGELRQLFTFKPHIVARVRERLKHIRRFHTNNTVFIGMHIRRGDYVTAGSRVGFTTATKRFFKKAMNYYRAKYNDVIILAISDDINWCKKTFKNESNLFFMEGNSPEVDMAIMAASNHTITSVGTYSFWCGWLANGTNIYYDKVFVPGSRSSRNYRNNRTSDYFYPGWIAMS